MWFCSRKCFGAYNGKVTIIDLLGQKFGRLLVVRKTDQRIGHSVVWECLCDCGNRKLVASTNLRRGTTKSCRCLARDRMRTARFRLKPPGVSAFLAVRHWYVSNAKRQGREFALTDEQFRTLTSADCWYCGASPQKVSRTTTGTYVYNGIDRMDSFKGYTIDNCVPCCSVCNRTKNDLSAAEFLHLVFKVFSHTRKRLTELKSCFGGPEVPSILLGKSHPMLAELPRLV